MHNILTIITVTKDDYAGVCSTIKSTRQLRAKHGIRQIIIDSSNQDTADQIRIFAAEENNLDYVWQAPAGIASAFNLGLTSSSSDWVWFLNGRDEVHSDLEPGCFVDLLRKNKADAVQFDTVRMQSGKQVPHPPMWALWPPLLPNWISHPSMVLRRSLFDRYGMFDKKFTVGMDTELWMRFFTHKVVVDLISMPVVLFDETGVSNMNIEIASRETLKIEASYILKLLGISLRRIWTKSTAISIRILTSFSWTVRRWRAKNGLEK